MRSVMTLAVVVLVVLSVSVANATIIGTYVDAVPSNTDHATSPGSPWGTTVDSVYDNLWQTNQGETSTHESYDVFDGGSMMCCYGAAGREPNTPTIATTITGLTPGALYDVRLLFGNHTAVDQRIRAGLSLVSLSSYMQANSDVAVQGTVEYEGGYMDVRQALLGTGQADSSGNVKVYVAYDPVAGDSLRRAIYDGVSYELVPEPGTLALLATGLIGLLCYAWRKRK